MTSIETYPSQTLNYTDDGLHNERGERITAFRSTREPALAYVVSTVFARDDHEDFAKFIVEKTQHVAAEACLWRAPESHPSLVPGMTWRTYAFRTKPRTGGVVFGAKATGPEIPDVARTFHTLGPLADLIDMGVASANGRNARALYRQQFAVARGLSAGVRDVSLERSEDDMRFAPWVLLPHNSRVHHVSCHRARFAERGFPLPYMSVATLTALMAVIYVNPCLECVPNKGQR